MHNQNIQVLCVACLTNALLNDSGGSGVCLRLHTANRKDVNTWRRFSRTSWAVIACKQTETH